jgi:hypothetical protein
MLLIILADSCQVRNLVDALVSTCCTPTTLGRYLSFIVVVYRLLPISESTGICLLLLLKRMKTLKPLKYLKVVIFYVSLLFMLGGSLHRI